MFSSFIFIILYALPTGGYRIAGRRSVESLHEKDGYSTVRSGPDGVGRRERRRDDSLGIYGFGSGRGGGCRCCTCDPRRKPSAETNNGYGIPRLSCAVFPFLWTVRAGIRRIKRFRYEKIIVLCDGPCRADCLRQRFRCTGPAAAATSAGDLHLSLIHI